MKILAISKDLQTVDWALQSQLLVNEASTLHELYLGGLVREFYFTDAGDAVLILECGSLPEAARQLRQLPLVNQGLIDFDLRELQPYNGFQRLFRSDL